MSFGHLRGAQSTICFTSSKPSGAPHTPPPQPPALRSRATEGAIHLSRGPGAGDPTTSQTTGSPPMGKPAACHLPGTVEGGGEGKRKEERGE